MPLLAGERGSPLQDNNNFATFIKIVYYTNFQSLLCGRPMNAPTDLLRFLPTPLIKPLNKRPHEIREVFYHDISMRINEDFSFYRLYHGIYATICSRRTPAKACLLKLYFLLQFSKALSNRQYHRFSFRANQDIFCHNTMPCP